MQELEKRSLLNFLFLFDHSINFYYFLNNKIGTLKQKKHTLSNRYKIVNQSLKNYFNYVYKLYLYLINLFIYFAYYK